MSHTILSKFFANGSRSESKSERVLNIHAVYNPIQTSSPQKPSSKPSSTIEHASHRARSSNTHGDLSITHSVTTSATTEPVTRTAHIPYLTALAAACIMFIITAFCLTSSPSAAYAKDYDMPYVTIEANVQTDGSIQVTERRAFDFNGHFTAVWWDLSNLPSDGELSIQDVSVASATTDTVKAITRAATPDEQALYSPLQKVSFDLKWREEGGPGISSYSFDQGKNTLYAFLDAEDVIQVYQIKYTITNAAVPYKDVADLYWKYIGTNWAADSQNVECTIKLPNPTDVTAIPGTNVYAWGHGPLTGKLAFDDTGTRVTYSVDNVPAGSFAEAHVLFPTNWLSDVTDKVRQKHGDTMHLDTVLADEKTWADQANYKRMYSLIFVAVWLVVSLIIILWAIWYFMRHGREYRPQFKDQYWRDVPDAGVHPAVIDQLWRFDKTSNAVFTTGILHLVNAGAIQIHAEQTELPSGFFGRTKTQSTYVLTRAENAPYTADALNPIDTQTLHVLFDVFAGGSQSIRLDEVERYVKEHPQTAQRELERWQGILSAEVNKQEYFENTVKHAVRMLIVAGVFGAASVGVSYFTNDFIPIICAIPAIIVLFVLMTFMSRRTRKGVEVYARAKALKNWLTDFTAIDERPILDITVWGEFMVYAHIFGVTRELKDQLVNTYPELFESDAAFGYPMLWWYMPHASMTNLGETFDSALTNAWSQTETTLNQALSEIAGNSSSGGGFGGGFSMGGGGGFGGGGGGAR